MGCVLALGVGLLGCNGATPSGLNAASGAATGGGGTGSGSGGASGSAVRIVAWKLDDVLPIQQDQVWLFMNDTGSLNLQTVDLLVSGQSVSQGGNYQVQGMQLSKGLLFTISPSPNPGDTLQITVDDNNGNTLQSNTITVQAGPFAQANLPTTAGGGFNVTAPQYGASGVGSNADIVFDHAGGQAPSYQVVVFQIDPNQGSISGIPVAAEVPSGTWVFTCGQSNGGTEFANDPLPNPGDFITHVVALDASGWGIGTTVDVQGYNSLPPGLNSSNITQQQLAILNTWPYFTSN
ncbi:MAG: hypothetical protein D6776_06505 [Planctomycetota bacterium]|nr:MAG: hypothetical protein D6776_06505 [Planctomycetota bacterium]